MRFAAPPAPPPDAQLERLRLDQVSVGGAALVSLASMMPPLPTKSLRMHAGAALAEHADCAPAHAHAPCRFARV